MIRFRRISLYRERRMCSFYNREINLEPLYGKRPFLKKMSTKTRIVQNNSDNKGKLINFTQKAVQLAVNEA